MQEQDSLISVYDVSGKIISNKLRKDVDKKNDILKTVIILVINNQNKVFITKIPSNHFTERWGASAAGMVRKDEKIIDAAKRTLNRELDLLKNPIFLSENFYDFNVIKRFMSVFYVNLYGHVVEWLIRIVGVDETSGSTPDMSIIYFILQLTF